MRTLLLVKEIIICNKGFVIQEKNNNKKTHALNKIRAVTSQELISKLEWRR